MIKTRLRDVLSRGLSRTISTGFEYGFQKGKPHAPITLFSSQSISTIPFNFSNSGSPVTTWAFSLFRSLSRALVRDGPPMKIPQKYSTGSSGNRNIKFNKQYWGHGQYRLPLFRTGPGPPDPGHPVGPGPFGAGIWGPVNRSSVSPPPTPILLKPLGDQLSLTLSYPYHLLNEHDSERSPVLDDALHYPIF